MTAQQVPIPGGMPSMPCPAKSPEVPARPPASRAAAAPGPPPRVTLQRTLTLGLRDGLHARPASMIVRVARRFSCVITVEKDRAKANARSILGVMGLAAGYGSRLRFTATGTDALPALEALESLFARNFSAILADPGDSLKPNDYHPLRFLHAKP
jgi:phosphocarrier protein HPr